MTDIDTLTLWLRQSLGLDSDDLPNVTNLASDPPKIGAYQLLNESYWEILDRLNFREKESSGTFPTVAGTRYYQVPTSFDALRMISVEDLDSGLHTPLERMTMYEYETIYSSDEDTQGKPQKYGREKNGIRIWPTPDDVYTLTIKFWAALSDLSSTNSFPEIPRAWHEVIKFGALWRGYLLIGDHARAGNIQRLHEGMLNKLKPVEAKEETDTHLGGVEVAGYDGAL